MRIFISIFLPICKRYERGHLVSFSRHRAPLSLPLPYLGNFSVERSKNWTQKRKRNKKRRGFFWSRLEDGTKQILTSTSPLSCTVPFLFDAFILFFPPFQFTVFMILLIKLQPNQPVFPLQKNMILDLLCVFF